MSEDPVLHAKLVARQSDEELRRKADKARMHRGNLWTQEELDHADRQAAAWHAMIDEALK